MPRRHHESLGELISTLVFFGVALTLFVASLESFEIQNKFKGYGFLIAGFMCFLGGLRYPIARTTDKLKKKRDKKWALGRL